MKIFVFTYDRYSTITTTKALDDENIDYRCLCHGEDDRIKYNKAGVVNPEKMISTGRPRGLGHNRNSALEMMKDGEWALFLVDDWVKATEYDGYDTEPKESLPIFFGKSTTEWGKRFQKQISMQQFVDRAKELIDECERRNIHLGGFASYTNPAYRAEKWKTNVLADGRAIVVRKTKLKYDPEIQTIDDYGWSAENITFGNGTLVNQWVLPECRRYTEGAYGTINQRMEQKIKDCKYLVAKYPKLIAYKNKSGWPDKSHITIRPMNPNTLERYKFALPELRKISKFQ